MECGKQPNNDGGNKQQKRLFAVVIVVVVVTTGYKTPDTRHTSVSQIFIGAKGFFWTFFRNDSR